MGGMGSGGWNHSGRACVEETAKLTIATLSKAGALAPGAYCVSSWAMAGREIASIGVRGEGGAVRLLYSSGKGADARRVDERVAVRWRSCRFGGARPYFACPRCGGEVLNLHLSGARFICRICARLTYAIRRERARDRHLRIANRLRRKLGGAPGVLSRFGPPPKHMRRRTYERIITEIQRREALALAVAAAWVMKWRTRTPLR